jgi:hypothetical protein
MFFGIILGIILTIGAAYVYDSARGGSTERPLVNWDVANRLFKALLSSAQTGLARMTGRAKDK